jgi:hypothetical protein
MPASVGLTHDSELQTPDYIVLDVAQFRKLVPAGKQNDYKKTRRCSTLSTGNLIWPELGSNLLFLSLSPSPL